MGKNKVNDQEKLDQIDTGLSLDFIVDDSELSLSPLEVDVSIANLGRFLPLLLLLHHENL